MTPSPRALPPQGTLILLALTAALLLFRLGRLPLLGPDEPRYARVAVEMARSGDFVTPTLQGQPWLEKPALYYWLAAGAFRTLGESEMAARLPSALAMLLLVGVTALVGARLYSGRAGLHAGFVLATSLLAFAYGHAASMDMLLAATVTAGVGLVALRVLGIAGRLAVPVAGVFLGLATLAKGPIGFLLPGLVVVGFLLATRDWPLLRPLLSPWGLLLFLLVAGPWYLAVYRAQGQAFIDVFFLDHNLARFTSTVHHHPGSIVYYLPVLLIGLFPWSGLLLPALGGLRPRQSRTDLFLLLWALLPLVFFSLAGSKLPGYILPCLPPLAILMGGAIDRLSNESLSLTLGTGLRAAALVGLALGAAIVTGPFVLWRRGDPHWSLAVPTCAWALITTYAFARRVGADLPGAFRLLRVGGAGLLLLVASAAPTFLADHESGRTLFLPAAGRQVLAWGAWRTAWMAGYFYNDGKVRPVETIADVVDAAAGGPVLVLCGPGERRWLERLPAVKTLTLAEGPRQNALLKVEMR